MLALADVLAALSQRDLAGAAMGTWSTGVTGVEVDSRRVARGSLFVALKGRERDGHDFICEAIASGAAAVIAERPAPSGVCRTHRIGEPVALECGPPICFVVGSSLEGLHAVARYWRRRHTVRTIGVTGSVGKSTCKELIATVLGRRFRTLRSEGNYNNEIGLPLTLLRLESGHERMVLEMGMYGLGEIALLAEMAEPQVGVVTNIGPSHLERLGSIERIVQAKSELVQALPSGEDGGVAILNADDPLEQAMSVKTRARILTYGLSKPADVWADEIESRGLEGMRFRLHHGQETVHARLPMLGRHSVHTALSAAAVGLEEGLSWDEILAGLSDQVPQLRLVALPGPEGSTVLDDSYNASPASSVAALNLLAELDGRKLAVLGDMYELGSYEGEGHKLVGRRAREVADVLVTVGRLGRTIAEEALAVGMPAEAVYMAEANAGAIELLRALLRPGDVVLVKGSRGLCMDEIVTSLTQGASVRAGAKES